MISGHDCTLHSAFTLNVEEMQFFLLSTVIQ